MGAALLPVPDRRRAAAARAAGSGLQQLLPRERRQRGRAVRRTRVHRHAAPRPRRNGPLPDRVRRPDHRVRGRAAPPPVAGNGLSRTRQHAVHRGDGDVSDGSRRPEQRGLLRGAVRLWRATLLSPADLRRQRDDVVAGRARRFDAADPRDGARLRPPHAAAFLVPRLRASRGEQHDVPWGTAALPPGAAGSPAETVFVAPEVFLGPFRSPISDGTRVAAGVSFNVVGDKVHAQTYTVTAAFDIPNPYGY